jgi:hypothetical protein
LALDSLTVKISIWCASVYTPLHLAIWFRIRMRMCWIVLVMCGWLLWIRICACFTHTGCFSSLLFRNRLGSVIVLMVLGPVDWPSHDMAIDSLELLCVELTCLEKALMHAVIVVNKGFVGTWIWPCWQSIHSPYRSKWRLTQIRFDPLNSFCLMNCWGTDCLGLKIYYGKIINENYGYSGCLRTYLYTIIKLKEI